MNEPATAPQLSLKQSIAKFDVTKEHQWVDLARHWNVRPDSVYLNHGSFGFTPNPVRHARRKWINRLDEQPMDFYVRHLEEHFWNARSAVANFVGCKPHNLVFVDNATYGMNVIAQSFALSSGDNVLMNSHEYGAVHRIWERACSKQGATCSVARLDGCFGSHEELIQTLLDAATDKTRLVVLSHITSATAIVLPVEKICAAFAERGIPVCIDGPHAPAQIPLNISKIKCAFYTASCHKWLCGVLGSGFLFVAREFQNQIEPAIKSWGRLLPAMPEKWDEEFTWIGTRDPSPFLSLPAAIEFMDSIGLDNFRRRSRYLAEYAEQTLVALTGREPLASREDGWYASMAHVPLPPSASGNWENLQDQLWEEIGIEVPIIHFDDDWFVRVSCHLYNNTKQIDILANTLGHLMSLG